ncbi:MAG TPA: SlyX family protein, partial [Pirellulales bacterium]|nr:SlyX family protein [Pirellulales bacterium]
MAPDPAPGDLSARLTRLEELCMHQEQLVGQLNEVLLRQQAQVDRLEETLRRLDAQWEQLQDRYTEVRRPED